MLEFTILWGTRYLICAVIFLLVSAFVAGLTSNKLVVRDWIDALLWPPAVFEVLGTVVLVIAKMSTPFITHLKIKMSKKKPRRDK